MLTGKSKSQSAMEYLMTYGWAILIIAVVLGALFSLGVFNASNFAPKAPPGGCHVFRPGGPGTKLNLNLVGSCTNELPEYVAQFNGASSYINLGTAFQNTETGTKSISFSIWFNIRSPGVSNYPIQFGDTFGSPRNGYDLFVYTGTAFPTYMEVERFYAGTANVVSSGAGSIMQNTWYYATATYDGSNLNLYLNGAPVGSKSGVTNAITPDSVMSLGAGSLGIYPTNSILSNFQIYNTSLDANTVQYLYQEGIGGVPVSLQYLVGWWPLNGDTKDYSGNNNNGVPTGISFNGTWTTGYTIP